MALKVKPDWPAGCTIIEVRPMTEAELDTEGWAETRHGPRTCLVLDDGGKLYPSQDDEGNGAGALFGVDPDGKTVAVYPVGR